MRQIWRRLLAGVLTAVMLLTALPAQALAALADNSAEQNAAILAELTEFYGDERTALEAMELLRRHGLIDEAGNPLTDWRIEKDGELLTLEQARALIQSGANLNDAVTVDGDTLTLGDLKIMLEIEDEIRRLRETYFPDGLSLTDAQRESLASLKDQLWDGGISLASEADLPQISIQVTGANDRAVEVQCTLSQASEEEVSFTLQLLGAALYSSDPVRTVTFAPGETRQDVTLSASRQSAWDGTRTAYVQANDASNAVFTGGGTGLREAVTASGTYFGAADLGTEIVTNPLSICGVNTNGPRYGVGSSTFRGETVLGLSETQRRAISSGAFDSFRIDYNQSDIDTRFAAAQQDLEQFKRDHPGAESKSETSTVPVKLYYTAPYTAPGYPNTYMRYEISGMDGLRGRVSSAFVSGGVYYYADAVLVNLNGESNSDNYKINATVHMQDTSLPTVTGVSFPEGTFFPGDVVPVRVSFSEPVRWNSGARARINGQDCAPIDSEGTGRETAFLYTVPQSVDPTIQVTNIRGFWDLTGQGHTMAADTKVYTSSTSSTVLTVLRDNLFSTASIHNDESRAGTTITLELGLNAGQDKQWLLDELSGNNNTAKSVYAQVNGQRVELSMDPQDTTKLTGAYQHEAFIATDPETVEIRFLLDRHTGNQTKWVELFNFRKSANVYPAVPVTANMLSIQYAEGFPANGSTIYPDKLPQAESSKLTVICQSGAAAGGPNEPTWADTRSITCAGADGQPVNPNAHFMWSTSNPAVATVDETGTVAFTGAPGQVTFRLTALNAGNNSAFDDALGPQTYQYEGITVTMGEGRFPTLTVMPASVKAGNDAVIRWTSNITDKNEAVSPGYASPFTVAVYKADYSGGGEEAVKGAEIYRSTVTSTKAAPVTSLTVPASLLQGVSAAGKPSYLVEVSGEYLAAVTGETKNGTVTSNGGITITSQPTKVQLVRPELYTTDAVSQGISWTLINFDALNGAKVRVTVTNNDTNEKAVSEEYTGQAGINASGTLSFQPAVSAGALRTPYTVEVWAKNPAESEEDWSFDAYVLYVYDDDALRVLTGGEDKEEITLSNRERIRELLADGGQEAVLALNGQINLQTPVSINHDDYDWNALEDQITWSLTDLEGSGAAELNYRQGTMYQNIDNFAYTSYAPITDFLLSGVYDGKTRVTAAHKFLAGLSDSVDVNVETLRDRLYLFQFYPAQTVEITYTTVDAAGQTVTRTASTTEDGRAAIYEENGITGDVCLKAEGADGTVYLGTVYRRNLQSSEPDAALQTLYPVNLLQLRKASQVELYFLDSGGKAYTDALTVWAGAYRNGEYLPGVTFGGQNGAGDQGISLTPDENGRYSFQMDLTQMVSETQTAPVSAADELEFIFEVHADGCYPLFYTVSGTLNEKQSTILGQRQVQLEPCAAADAGKPYIIRQELAVDGSRRVYDVKGETTNVGPSADYPSVHLITEVCWWDELAAAVGETDGRTVELAAVPNDRAPVQSAETGFRYPFSAMPFTTLTVELSKESMEKWGFEGAEERRLELRCLGPEGQTVKRESLPLRATNMVQVPKLSQNEDLEEELELVVTMTEDQNSYDQSGLPGPGMVGTGLSAVSRQGWSLGVLGLKLVPTNDPKEFRGILTAGISNMADDVSKINIETEDDGEDEAWYQRYEGDLDVLPGMGDYADYMDSGSVSKYLDKANSELDEAIDNLTNRTRTHGGDTEASYMLEGYMEVAFTYDDAQDRWHMEIINGGFRAGGGLGYTWTFNGTVGPIPVTASLSLGASVDVQFQMTSDRENFSMTDYLTQLQIIAYIRAFGGLGLDYSVIALKVGLYGQMTATARFRWLNRHDGAETSGAHIKAKGEVGVEFLIKFLFISYEGVLWSESFDLLDDGNQGWEEIEEYWAWAKNGYASRYPGLSAAAARYEGAQLLMADPGSGSALYQSSAVPRLENRDYLTLFERTEGGIADSSGETGNEDAALLDGAGEEGTASRAARASLYSWTRQNVYPYTDPVLTEDGQLMAGLDDNPAGKPAAEVLITDTRAAYALRNDPDQVGYSERNGYGQWTVIDNSVFDGGFGDSQLKLAGTEDHAVAAWTRLRETVEKEGGSELTATDQAVMLDATEVVAAIWDGSSWTAIPVTENSTPDLAPVAAMSADGSKALVAWRSVGYSDENNVTAFDQRDYIYYRTWDKANGWSDTAQALYNGTNGVVKGLEAAMLPDGTAAVVFTVEDGAGGSTTYVTDSGTVRSGLEVFYRVVDPDGTAVRSVRVTDDQNADENPRITTVNLKEDDAESVFLLGWYSTQDANGVQDGDLQFRAVDRQGNLIPGVPATLSSGSSAAVTGDFRFVKGAKTLDQLYVVWPTWNDGEKLQGIRFSSDGKSFSGVQNIVTYDSKVSGVSAFDAHLESDGSVRTVSLQAFDAGVTREVEAAPGKTVTVPVPRYDLYVSSPYTFREMFYATSFQPVDIDSIQPNSPITMSAYVENAGTEPITRLSTRRDGNLWALRYLAGSEWQSTSNGRIYWDLSEDPLLPGEGRTLSFQVMYEDQADLDRRSPDVYPQIATTESSSASAYRLTSDRTQWSIPDIGIRDAAVIAEEGQLRAVRYSLYNTGTPLSENKNNSIRVGLYSDPECTQLIGYAPESDNGVLSGNFETSFFAGASADSLLPAAQYTVTGDALELINQGAFSRTHILNLENSGLKDSGFSLTERNSIYLKAEVLQGSTVRAEPNEENNVVKLTFAGLETQRGEEFTTTYSLENDPDNPSAPTTARILVQNNLFDRDVYGNLLVSLLDEGGNVLETVQTGGDTAGSTTLLSKDPGLMTTEGLLHLPEEGCARLETVFSRQGAGISVAFHETLPPASSGAEPQHTAELSALTFDGVARISLDSFVQSGDDPNLFTAEARVNGLSSTLVSAVARDPDAAVTIGGTAGPVRSVALLPHENTIDVVVTSGDQQRTYRLKLEREDSDPGTDPGGNPGTDPGGNPGTNPGGNSGSGSSGGSGGSGSAVTVTRPAHGKVTASPANASQGSTVTLTVTPDSGYALNTLTVTDSRGNELRLTEQGDGSYTFTMPAGRVSVNAAFAPLPGSGEQPCDGGEDCPSRAFTDLGGVGTWYHEAVDYVLRNEIMNGYSNGTFGPDNRLTRAHLAQILYNREGRPAVTAESPFTDVAAGVWYTDAITWAAAEGIVGGYGNGRFGPNDNITREQLAVMLWRYAGSPVAAERELRFTDADRIGSYALEAIRWAVEQGVLNGYSDGRFNPKGLATRAQTAQMLKNYFTRQTNQEDPS